ncbi:MAG: BTAD domain-containing putative transcriptional regulator [Solirubrobacteraceae bacterium]
MVEFRVLGSLEVAGRDGPLTLGARKQRALLAVLLLHRGEAVSSDRLIDEIWGEQPPASANKIVQGYVSNLRKALGDGLLVTERGGYALRVEPGQLDVDRFETLVSQGRDELEQGDALTAAAVLREALAVWRGPALADFAYEPFAQAEIARLEESRLAALEDRIDADLASGKHARLVGELEALVREHPLRERLRGQLMLALYRSGRQADALESYRNTRRTLSDELGLEPGPALKDLEQAILAQDTALNAPARAAGPPLAVGARRGGLLIAAGGALLLAAITAVALILTSSGSNSVRVAPNNVAVIDTRTNTVIAAVPVGARPGTFAFGSGSLWVANQDDQTISRVDPSTLQSLRMITVGNPPTGIAASAGGIWVVESNLNPASNNVFVSRIDPEFDTLARSRRIGNVIPSGSGTVAAQGDSVWVAPSSGLLTRVDATTGAVAQQLDPNASPSGVVVGDGAVWLSDTEADNVTRIDPSGLLTPIAVGGGPTGIALDTGGVWVADSLDNAVTRINPGTRSVITTIPVGRSPAGVAVGAGSVWVANSGDGTVSRIDPASNKVVATIAVGGSPQAITIADGRAWVTVDAQSVGPTAPGAGGGTLRIESPIDVDHMDPALAFGPLSLKLVWATCAGLLDYPDASGPASSRVIPEVAQSLPARSPDGRTYTFKIRSGYRFSPPSNQPVTAQTFKYTIERTLNPRMHSPVAAYFTDIVGAGPYMAGKTSHIAGVVANGNSLTIRLLKPAGNLPPLIALPSFCAVPTNTPIEPNVRMVPSAGPYYVASYAPGHGVVLLRNPNYHGGRPRHFSRIELSVGISGKRSVADIQAGRADYTVLGLWTVSPTVSPTGGSTAGDIAPLAAQLAAHYGPGSPAARSGRQQYFVNPLLELDYVLLNTRRPLFSSVRMRQAVNYAIDRRTLAALGDGFEALPERPTDHYLPPGMAGFRDVNVYPLTPDLASARRLVNEGGRTAVLYTCDISPCPEGAQIIKTELAAIGLRVRIKTFPFPTFVARIATPGEPFDLAWAGYIADYPDPQGILDPMLELSAVGPTFDDPTYQRKLAAAAQLSGPKRYLAYGNLDLDLTRNAAPLAAIGNLLSYDFFSARIGCQTYSAYFGMDLGALCLRGGAHHT